MLQKIAQNLNRLFHIGTCLGVPLEIHVTLLIALIVLFLFKPFLACVITSVFLIVVLHEFGHVFAAKILGHKTERVELNPLGGVAYIDIPSNAFHEFVIAIAGPLVNVLLIPILGLLAKQHPLFFLVFYCNITILLFNLLPIFPMDGGRILRSTLQMVSGRRSFSTIIAVRISQLLCCALITYAILQGQFMLILIAVMLISAAESEITIVDNEPKINHASLHAELLMTLYFCETSRLSSVCNTGFKVTISMIEKRIQELFNDDSKNLKRNLSKPSNIEFDFNRNV